MFNKMKYALMRFMYGRYGVDELYYALFGSYFVLILLNIFIRNNIIYWVGMIAFIYSMFRFFSKNIYKRRQENQWFLKYWNKIRNTYNLQFNKFKERDTKSYHQCPNCKMNLRLPRVKGEHSVDCPKCHHHFKVKIR